MAAVGGRRRNMATARVVQFGGQPRSGSVDPAESGTLVTELAGHRSPDTRRRIGQDAAKRVLDFFGSLAGIVVLSPLLGLLWCMVRWTSPGPALFRQERLGRDKRPFTLLKFRTMDSNNDDRIHRQYVTSLLSEGEVPTGGQRGFYKLETDPRITKVGAWLRRFSLDELPQLFNVLRGQMSLVGPRPVLAWEAEMFRPSDHQRFDVKPGITGLWQVSGRSRLSYRQQLELDVEYVRRRSFGLDLAILVGTIPALFRDGAV
jgi:lipopolysaccharide/colanic/teichoic acid biosynthesis glycosyltransferase